MKFSKSKLWGLGFILSALSVALPAYATSPAAGVMPYNADQATPAGFVRMVDNTSSPARMIFMERVPSATGFTYTGFLLASGGIAANTYIPSTALKDLLIGSNGTTTWVVSDTSGMLDSGNYLDRVVDPVTA